MMFLKYTRIVVCEYYKKSVMIFSKPSIFIIYIIYIYKPIDIYMFFSLWEQSPLIFTGRSPARGLGQLHGVHWGAAFLVRWEHRGSRWFENPVSILLVVSFLVLALAIFQSFLFSKKWVFGRMVDIAVLMLVALQGLATAALAGKTFSEAASPVVWIWVVWVSNRSCQRNVMKKSLKTQFAFPKVDTRFRDSEPVVQSWFSLVNSLKRWTGGKMRLDLPHPHHHHLTRLWKVGWCFQCHVVFSAMCRSGKPWNDLKVTAFCLASENHGW